MKFPYKKIPILDIFDISNKRFVYRPIIPVYIRNKNKEVGYEVLIDSGADYCIFHSDIAAIIGIDWRDNGGG